jgi:hypothetical protein
MAAPKRPNTAAASRAAADRARERRHARAAELLRQAGWTVIPPQEDIGPVLHPDDALANKVAALFGRARPRDFIDVDAAVTSGRYDHERLLRLAEQADGGFDRRVFAAALEQADVLPDSAFAEYGVVGPDLTDLRHRFASWRAELEGPG